jgi:hypothetical protein
MFFYNTVVLGGNLYFAFDLVPQTRTLQLDLAICQLDAARLRSMMTDVAAHLARRARSGQLFGA